MKHRRQLIVDIGDMVSRNTQKWMKLNTKKLRITVNKSSIYKNRTLRNIKQGTSSVDPIGISGELLFEDGNSDING